MPGDVWSISVHGHGDDDATLKKRFREETGYERCAVDGWEVAEFGMVKDEDHTMAIVINLASDKGGIKAFDRKKKEIKSIKTERTPENNGKVLVLFLTSGCDALIQGKPSVKYIRKT